MGVGDGVADRWLAEAGRDGRCVAGDLGRCDSVTLCRV